MTLLTLITYKSGRQKIMRHKTAAQMKRDRINLDLFPTVLSYKTPTTEEIRNVAQSMH